MRFTPEQYLDSSAEVGIEDVVSVVDVEAVVVVVVAVVPAAVAGCHRLKTGSAFWAGERIRVGATSRTFSGTN